MGISFGVLVPIITVLIVILIICTTKHACPLRKIYLAKFNSDPSAIDNPVYDPQTTPASGNSGPRPPRSNIQPSSSGGAYLPPPYSQAQEPADSSHPQNSGGVRSQPFDSPTYDSNIQPAKATEGFTEPAPPPYSEAIKQVRELSSEAGRDTAL